jgi:hypothetical protein
MNKYTYPLSGRYTFKFEHFNPGDFEVRVESMTVVVELYADHSVIVRGNDLSFNGYSGEVASTCRVENGSIEQRMTVGSVGPGQKIVGISLDNL